MSAPGFLRASVIIASKDLRQEWRTLETLSATAIFSLAVLVVFQFAFGAAAPRELGVERLMPGVVWTVLAFASVVTLLRSFQLERGGETLGALFLAPVDRGAIFTGKLAANLVKLTLLQGLLLPAAALFMDHDLRPRALPLLGVLFLHGLGLCELGTLFAAVGSRLGRGEALVVTLLFPAASPLLISAVRCTAACLGSGSMAPLAPWLWATVGFDMLYFFVGLWVFEFALEE